MRIPVFHRRDCHRSWYTGPPWKSARTALMVTVAGWFWANGCSQPGIVDTGTSAELAQQPVVLRDRVPGVEPADAEQFGGP